jgi:hypothetical protein
MILDHEHAHRHSMQKAGDNRVTAAVTVLSPAGSYNSGMDISKLTVPALGALTAVIVAGCGGTAPKAPASSSAPIKDPKQAAYKFSACMRAHGVSNFPDPVVHQSGNSMSIGIRVDPTITGSPAFKSAQAACQSIMPGPMSPAQQAAQEHLKAEHVISFARCMRAHGVTNFPDPDTQGDIRPDRLAAAGVDLHAPNVIASARACVPASGGTVSQAAISQATGSGGGSTGSGSSSTGSSGTATSSGG